MLEFKLQYRGKKIPFTTPPIVKPAFVFTGDPLWIPASAAALLMQINPSMFAKSGERDLENPVVDAASIKAKPELAVPDEPDIQPDIEPQWPYNCALCGKGYKIERFYQNHIATCTGPDEDDK
jgi:hypothetical protein